ncbi:MAG TPA: MurR/RpiR family transcriptional regulator [Vicinamibacterales bacterium]|nr:MurR/RpiR family transcriptional regulator [Vicinamibacterales bacterium]
MDGPQDGLMSKLPSELLRGLSPRRRELVRRVLDRPRDYVLLSARKLAQAVGADAMAVLRAIRDMGFHGYADFRRYLHELALAQATQLDTLQAGLARAADVSAELRESLAHDADNLAALRHTVDFRRLEALAARLYDARRIVLLGGDLASVLVTFLQYNLVVIDLPAFACTRPGEVAHAVRWLKRSDLVIAITFRRGLRQTVEGLRQARARGAYCVGITDTHLSPLARFAHEYFVTPVEGTLYGVSYVAPMALLNMLLVACAIKRRSRTIRLLKAADAEQRTGFRWYRDDDLAALRPAAPAASSASTGRGRRRSPPR